MRVFRKKSATKPFSRVERAHEISPRARPTHSTSSLTDPPSAHRPSARLPAHKSTPHAYERPVASGRPISASPRPYARAGRASSLFESQNASRSRSTKTDERGRHDRKFRPLNLLHLMGGGSLHPPSALLEPPQGLFKLSEERPQSAPAATAEMSALDRFDPADIERDRRLRAHWDGEQWHAGAAHGLSRDGAWLWLYHEDARWWALAGHPPSACLRHGGLWWTKMNGVWFVVHDGEPWIWRFFRDWDAQGLYHTATGTEMVYSKDFSRAAMITPGKGATVFDAASGAQIAVISEDQMPPRRRPKIPETLYLPPDIFAK